MSYCSSPAARRRQIFAAVATVLASAAIAVPASAAHAAGTGKGAALDRLAAADGSGHSSPAVKPLARRLTARTPAATARPAADPVPPPTTQPSAVTVTGTSGVVGLGATSTAAFVEFYLDGDVTGTPVPASSDGTAATVAAQVPTWGLANGDHAVAAADCASSDPATCNTVRTSAADPLHLANDAPVITAPADGSTVTGGFTITATAPGGGVQFLIDGVRRGFDGVAPYSFVFTGSALSTGEHSISVVGCSTDESRCAGPVGGPVTITSDSLHPKISSVSPSVFSPNGDKVVDTTKLTYLLPDTETVQLSVTTPSGAVVRGPVHAGTQAKGTHTWTWNGRNNGGHTAASGVYRVTVATSATVHGALVKGLVWRAVTVDTRAPVASGLSAATSVYPVHDGYRDTLPVKFRLDERAGITFTIRNAARHVVRTVRTTHAAGPVALAWNGRGSNGRIVPAGRYSWQMTVRDGVGNHRATTWHAITVSGKRLVAKSITRTINGDSFWGAGASDDSCAEASTSLSDYPHGVWLANACSATGGIASAFYHLTLPTAVVYSHFTVSVYGHALDGYLPSSLATGFGVGGGGNDFGISGPYEVTTSDEGWYRVGSIAASRYVSSSHRANIAVIVTDDDAPCEFDIKQVRVTLTYKVLG